MDQIYFTEEHQLFREFKRFLQKEVVPHIEKWENWFNRAFYLEKV
jgi:hypothetical protein